MYLANASLGDTRSQFDNIARSIDKSIVLLALRGGSAIFDLRNIDVHDAASRQANSAFNAQTGVSAFVKLIGLSKQLISILNNA